MGYDGESREYILKLTNLKKQEVILQTAVKGFGKKTQAQKITLSLELGKNNTPGMPDAVKPVQSTVVLNLNKDLQLEVSSMVVYHSK